MGIAHCTISGNSSQYRGGGIYDGIGCSPTLVDCTITGNTSQSGGGLYNSGSSPTLTNCTISGNSAQGKGGAMVNWNYSSPTLINCTVTGNTAQLGGGMYDNEQSSPTLINCILWGNTAGSITNEIASGSTGPNTVNASYSDIDAGLAGAGNIDLDPLFVNANNGNFNIEPYSPAVDAGNNAAVPTGILTDLAGNDRFQDVPTSAHSGAGTVPVVDMGAYEAAPVLAADAGGPYFVLPGHSVGLQALGASNVAGNLNYSWDLNDDGVFGDATGTNPTFLATGYSVGTIINVSLQLTDGGGHSIQANTSITIVPPVVYVDVSATGANNGSSWADAFNSLSSVLANTVPGTGQTIDVAQGTYYPILGTDRTATFQLKDGITIRGGYAGAHQPNPGARDISLYPTILSGNIGAQGSWVDNSYHVVNGSHTDKTAVLDGVTITGGTAWSEGNFESSGAGILDLSGSPTLSNCTITGNTAFHGGGMYNFESSSPDLTNCTISGNNVSQGGGGGIWNEHDSSPTLTNCTISGNTSDYGGGGGIYNEDSSSPVLSHCTITGNAANYGGGGAIYNSNSSPTLSNCTITGNSADSGGGICNRNSSSPTLISCTINGNTGAGVYNFSSSPILTNCAISRNTGGGIFNEYSVLPILTNCTIADNGGSGVADWNSSSPTLTNCTIVGNTSPVGAGIWNINSSSATLINCTITGNVAQEDGGGIYNTTSSFATLTNCILWGDKVTTPSTTSEIASGRYGTNSVIANYSDIGQSGFSGTGNVNTNPMFVRNPSPGHDGVWGTADDDLGDLQVRANSPVINAGSNAAIPSGITTDLAGNPRIVSGTVDMGAYEYPSPLWIVSSSLTASQLKLVFSTNPVTPLNADDLILSSGGSRGGRFPAGVSFDAVTHTATYDLSNLAVSFPAGVSFDAATHTATYDLSNLAGGVYTASIMPAAITDSNGDTLAGGFAASFLLIGNNQHVVLPGDNQTYAVQQYAFGDNSSLDIGNNTLAVQYSAGGDPASGLASLISTGYAGGTWNGTGIISTDTSGEPGNLTGVGYFDDGSAVTIRRSWYGDTNLDGQINADDYALILLGQQTHQANWQSGNFNYDTKVNADDWMRFILGASYSHGQKLIDPSDAVPAARTNSLISSKATLL